MKIINAAPDDAPLIAEAIVSAIGEDITSNLAGPDHSKSDVKELFTRLARMEDSQYSYRNARIATDNSGEQMGVCISYDGEDLIPLRRAFFEKARKVLGWKISESEIDELPGETGPEEFYLDTLMTLPSFRGRGVAKALIGDALSKARKTGKPLGLLCDIDNNRARRLYDSVGFKEIGVRPFAGHPMNHLQLQ